MPDSGDSEDLILASLLQDYVPHSHQAHLEASRIFVAPPPASAGSLPVPGARTSERHIGNSFQWRGAPQPNDIVEASAAAALEDIKAVSGSALGLYENTANTVRGRGGGRAVTIGGSITRGKGDSTSELLRLG